MLRPLRRMAGEEERREGEGGERKLSVRESDRATIGAGGRAMERPH